MTVMRALGINVRIESWSLKGVNGLCVGAKIKVGTFTCGNNGVVAESLCLKKMLDFWLSPLLNQVLDKEESKYIFIKSLYKRQNLNTQVLRGQRSSTI